MIKVKAKVDKILYPKNGRVSNGEWAIISCSLDEIIEGEPKLSSYGNFVVKGEVPLISYSDTYKIIGEFKEDKEYGNYYELIYMSSDYDLNDQEDKRKFLEVILSSSQIEKLYEFTDDPFTLIKNENIESLTKVNGIGLKSALKLIDKFKNNIDTSKAYVALNNYGLSKSMIDRLIIEYKGVDVLIEKLNDNPYILANEVSGIGFKKADAIALNMGMERNNVKRVVAFIKYYLYQEAQNGNSWVDIDVLYTELLDNVDDDLPDELFGQAMIELHGENVIWWDEDKTRIALYYYYQLEYNISKELKRLIEADKNIRYPENISDTLSKIEMNQGWTFTGEQKQAIQGALENNISIITGSGGTGKSSSVKAVVEVLKNEGYIVAQTALSGRAASRLAEITGDEGYTIHRLLGYNPKSGFYYTEYNPIPTDVIILDECSMLGGDLFFDLIKAIKSGCKLVILGDEGQLESIGSLNLFRDMIESDVIPVYKLTKIHRQAQKSAIITESIKVRQQKQLIPLDWAGKETRGELQDLVLDIHSESIYTAPKIIDYFKQELARVKDIAKIWCIVPTKFTGDACVYELNNEIQEIYNPSHSRKKEIKLNLMNKKKKYPYILREGDKIIIRKNEYKKTINMKGKITPIFNGNIGILESIDYDDNVIVNLDEVGQVLIPRSKCNIIQLGYAISCHSSQGSQCDTVIIGMDFSGFTLLSKEWLYTAMTRATKKCVLCAETKSLRYAIKTSKVPLKQTFLQMMLRNEI